MTDIAFDKIVGNSFMAAITAVFGFFIRGFVFRDRSLFKKNSSFILQSAVNLVVGSVTLLVLLTVGEGCNKVLKHSSSITPSNQNDKSQVGEVSPSPFQTRTLEQLTSLRPTSGAMRV